MRSRRLCDLWGSKRYFKIARIGPEKYEQYFVYEKIWFPCCGVWDEVVEQKGTLPFEK